MVSVATAVFRMRFLVHRWRTGVRMATYRRRTQYSQLNGNVYNDPVNIYVTQSPQFSQMVPISQLHTISVGFPSLGISHGISGVQSSPCTLNNIKDQVQEFNTRHDNITPLVRSRNSWSGVTPPQEDVRPHIPVISMYVFLSIFQFNLNFLI